MSGNMLRAKSLVEACSIAGVELSSVSRTKGRAVVIGDRPSKKNASILWHDDGLGGCICNWKGSVRVMWRESSLVPHANSFDQSHNEQERAIPTPTIQKVLNTIWNAAHKVQGHPYLLAKCLDPVATLKEITANQVHEIFAECGLKNSRGYPLTLWHGEGQMTGPILVVPVLRGSEWRTAQFIDAEGHKLMLKGGKFGGGYWCTRHSEEILGKSEIYIAEGVATAMSIDAVHNVPCVGALSCGNMVQVARYFKEKSPNSEIVLVADNDLSGAGLNCAWDAAVQVDGCYVMPTFDDGLIQNFKEVIGKEKRPSDFNDYYVATGQLKKKLG